MRQQLIDAIGWLRRQPLQHIAQVGVGIKPIEFCRVDALAMRSVRPVRLFTMGPQGRLSRAIRAEPAPSGRNHTPQSSMAPSMLGLAMQAS